MYLGKPFLIMYIGPALASPLGPISLYITDRVHVKNLVAMPKIAVTHIQNMAPGPPICIATATPAILPKPIVPDKAAVRALKWLTSPLSDSFECLPAKTEKACGRYKNGLNRDE